MSRILGILNFKGGTGKTTTVINLAAGLALRGARVLCVDLDAQGGLGTYFGIENYRYSLTDLLLKRAEFPACVVPIRDNLDIIPSNEGLMEAEGRLWYIKNQGKPAGRSVTKILKTINGYDYIILDYAPSITLLSKSTMLYTRELIVPVAMDYLALVGTRQVIKAIKTINRVASHKIKLEAIVPTFYYSRLRKDREIMDTLQQYFAVYLADPIRANVKLSEASSYKKSIYEYSSRSPGAIDYAHLVERIANHGG